MASGIPDPTADLDWSGYIGAIHEIFRRNAEAHPERVCCVETASSTTPERSYTYKQIFEASNILAHFLSSNGVTNGDVVMIWAHRSVDLVVAYMGTLASGATVSVLDPQYPPIRQQIYLEVSQPKALVQISKATQEAGPLAPIVRQYIDEELRLKCEVPSLKLEDDGFLSGGNINGKDVFTDARPKNAAPPETVVGPDSNPTLSFTSGSEGRPKGVLGRHYSLAYYFKWMAERFNLSSQSKWTMLSGIAHDPIQRDIFTPLFNGGQLLIPSTEDIQHEKLAEWMAKHNPTVTHLTPAMGQVLVGGASAKFPSLDRAFFVGDVLTTRDCRRLRELAPNVSIVNMYGTTETQRAVSYREVPPAAKDPEFLDRLNKDTIPAGRGMYNVQLLVVNREDRNKICSIGETGEIYVRAAGLAEEYLGDADKNREKFVTNWFVDNDKWVEADKSASRNELWRKYYKGPRDRMYRTGDLGRYIPSDDGGVDVECTGRADDQVKIRGFRIELNEIDSNLSQHSLIRDCKTVVQRNRNEEPNLVSYVVVETTRWKSWLKEHSVEEAEDEGLPMGPTVYLQRYRPLNSELRDHLKSKLPIYAIPALFIFLDKLPLNPNGKVDKPNLPFPDIAEAKGDASSEDLQRWDSMTKTEQSIASLFATLIPGLNSQAIDPTASFFDLGGHSLLGQQLLLKVRQNTGANVSISTLYQSPTLAEFAAQVDSLLKPSDGTANGVTSKPSEPAYSKALDKIVSELPAKYQSAESADLLNKERITVFLTGGTGFLGAYIIKDVLERTRQAVRLIVHVRGVRDTEAGVTRLRKNLQSYGIWQEEWSSRLSCVTGDLAKPQLGIDSGTWESLAREVDVVIHNGARVHWVQRFEQMRASNVDSTIDAIRLCNEGKPKTFTFVSSTSVLDTEHYVNLSDQQVSTGQGAISEEDDLQGSATGLGTGYGQTKWVSEQLVRQAGQRGLRGSVIRPGYILGDSETGVCNTDDFLIRLLKGCIQLSARPRIVNTVNSIPVNHVARIVVAAAFNPISSGVHVVHVTGHPRLRMNEYLSALEYYGYKAPECSYEEWKQKLESYVSAGSIEKDLEQHALLPLFHFCASDLPRDTRAPELLDDNAVQILRQDAETWTGVDESAGYGISRADVGRYLHYLCELGWLARPQGKGRPLPEVNITDDMRAAYGGVGGRGGVTAS